MSTSAIEDKWVKWHHVFELLIEKLKQARWPMNITLSDEERDLVDLASKEVDPTRFDFYPYEGPERIRNRYSFMVSGLIDKAIGPFNREKSERIYSDVMDYRLAHLNEIWAKTRFLAFIVNRYGYSYKTNDFVDGDGFTTNIKHVEERSGSRRLGSNEYFECSEDHIILSIDCGQIKKTLRIYDIEILANEILGLMEIGAYLGISREEEEELKRGIKNKHRRMHIRFPGKKEKPKNISSRTRPRKKEADGSVERKIEPRWKNEEICRAVRVFQEIVMRKISLQKWGEPVALTYDERLEVDDTYCVDQAASILRDATSSWYESDSPKLKESPKYFEIFNPFNAKKDNITTRQSSTYGFILKLNIEKRLWPEQARFSDAWLGNLWEITKDWEKARFLLSYYGINLEKSWSEDFCGFTLGFGHTNRLPKMEDADISEIRDEVFSLLDKGFYLGITLQEEALLKRAMLESDLDL